MCKVRGVHKENNVLSARKEGTNICQCLSHVLFHVSNKFHFTGEINLERFRSKTVIHFTLESEEPTWRLTVGLLGGHYLQMI